MSDPGRTSSAGATAVKWATGTIFFAGVLLLVAGICQAFVGLVALVNDTFFVVGEKWVFQFDLTSWGWIHIVIGAVLFVIGIFILRGAAWSAIAGVILAAFSAVVNFMWLPWTPIWSILVIALDVLIVWALSTHRQAIHTIDS